MEYYLINEQFVIKKNQTIITLSRPYIENSLKVFINGILTTNYTQLDSYNIEITEKIKKILENCNRSFGWNSERSLRIFWTYGNRSVCS